MDPLALYAVLAVLYLLMCVLTGVAGRKTRIGFWGFLFLSIFVTPLLPLVALFLTAPAHRPPR